MITLRRLGSPHDKKNLFDSFNSARQTWIVADSSSKRQLQNQLLSKSGFIEDECVMRATDFWCLLLKRLRPEFEVVSSDLTRVIVAQYLRDRDFAWARTPGAAQMACRYIKYLMPVLSHPHGREAIQSWFQENPDAQSRWGHWFEESFYLWRRFESERLVSLEWVTGFLVNEIGVESVWDREIIFDVGPCLHSVEAELLSTLGREINLAVIEPAPEWRNDFQKNFAGYAFLEALEGTEVFETKTEAIDPPSRFRYFKFTTMLAEVKQAIASCRKWLDEGVQPNEISIIAPDIACYWPVLRPYLREEGIPVRRKHATPLSVFPEIAQWFSRLKIAIGETTRGQLETVLFTGNKESTITFERFKILFGVIYGDDDLSRSEEIFELMRAQRIPADHVMTRDHFLTWALSFWKDSQETEKLYELLKNFLPSGPASLKLPAKSWIEHLTETAVRDNVHVTLKEGDADGINCLDLASSEHVFSTHTVLLGLTEKALRREEQVSILPKDLFSLNQSLGFSLPVLEDSRAEFSARWLFEDRDRDFVVTTPLSDFSGNVETPALLWLRGAAEQGDPSLMSVPEKTRWDEIQESEITAIAKTRGWPQERESRVLQSVRQDRGEKELFLFGGDLVRSLSASGFEDYLNCPFVFASKRLFKLSDLPSVDLDIDHMTKGKLVHALFEDLTADPIRYDWTETELEQVVEACREREGVVLGDEKMWTAMRRRYVVIAKRFLEFERAWRTKFPKTKTLGRELEVRGVITPDAELKKQGEGLTFRGSIDRVDTDADGHAVVIDYKSTKGTNVVHHNKWLENNIMQLLLYAMAVENGLSPIGPHEVIGALYFVVRDLTREHGFMLQEYDGILFQTRPRMSHGLTAEEKRALFERAREKLRTVYTEIKKGVMHPHPFDKADCRICQWRTVCRAPHLL